MGICEDHNKDISKTDGQAPERLDHRLHRRWGHRVGKFESGYGKHHFTGGHQQVLRHLPEDVNAVSTGQDKIVGAEVAGNDDS